VVKPELCRIEVYGSAANGLLETTDSDLDLTLMISPPEDCSDVPKFLNSLSHEKILNQALRINDGASKPAYSMSAGFLRDFKMKNINISLSINKTLELINSSLLTTYVQTEPTFHKVALILKKWNKGLKKTNGIESTVGLNSFTICLMLMYYMQSNGSLDIAKTIGEKGEDNLIHWSKQRKDKKSSPEKTIYSNYQARVTCN
jgi:DNA polymerase sigma